MYTQCPQCMTYFQVTAEHLKIAQGNVRCGHCRNVFSALGNLTEKLPEPKNPSRSEQNEDAEDDYLTDEEMGEFEDFDTNIYDDEDSIFDAFIDETDESETKTTGNTPIASKPAATASQPATSKNARTNSSSNTRRPALASDPNSASAIINRKLPSLAEGQKAQLKKLLQAKLDEQLKAAAAAETARELAPAKPTTVKTVASQKSPATSNVEKTVSASNPRAGVTQSKSKPATQAISEPDPLADAKKPAPNTNIKTPMARDAQPGKLLKPDIPVQSSAADVDFESALQALDELEINDEHAEFLSSVLKEFEATNITNTPQPEPAPAARSLVPATTQATESAKKKPTPLAAKKAKLKKLKKKLRRKKTAVPIPANKPTATAEAIVDTSAPDNIPVLPAILREAYQEEATQHRLTPGTIAWGVASMVLMLFFLGQTVYFKHDQLAQVSGLRPIIKSFCHQFHCRIALQYDASELELLGQDIRSHPKVKGALMVSTTMINKADFRQAYPGLQITFTDMNGQKVAMRRFLPEEYLPKGTRIKRGMAPDTPIEVHIELMDPGRNAINFEFDFFKSN